MKRFFIILVVLLVAVFIGNNLFNFGLTVGSQKMPTVNFSEQLNKLETELLKETNGGSIYFYPIPKHELRQCRANFTMDLSIRNDSITQSKANLDQYMQTVNQRIEEQLDDEPCIDSLIIEVFAYNSQSIENAEKSKKFVYSFPLK